MASIGVCVCLLLTSFFNMFSKIPKPRLYPHGVQGEIEEAYLEDAPVGPCRQVEPGRHVKHVRHFVREVGVAVEEVAGAQRLSAARNAVTDKVAPSLGRVLGRDPNRHQLGGRRYGHYQVSVSRQVLMNGLN